MNRRGKTLFSLCLALTATVLAPSACLAASARVIERSDVPYGAEVPAQKHRLDVFFAAGVHNAPVVVFVHGGDWTRNDRKTYSFLGRSLAAEGLVVIVPSYRLWPNANGAQMTDDVANATAWAVSHAPQFGGKPNSVILIGHSSGAHLAELIALDPQYLSRYQLSPSVVHGVIAISGIDDLTYLNSPVVSGAFGRTPAQRWNFSPLKFARHDVPPFEIICAQADVRVLCTQAQIFFLRLRLHAANADYYVGPGNHGTEMLEAATPLDRLHLKIVQFVRAHS